MWTYQQATGVISQDGTVKGHGYSGFGPGKNNPAMESIHDVGPIPRGRWQMTQWIDHDAHLGYGVIVLEPAPGTETFGRSGFRWHGGSQSHPGTASHGCIVLGWTAGRFRAWESGDHDLEVV